MNINGHSNTSIITSGSPAPASGNNVAGSISQTGTLGGESVAVTGKTASGLPTGVTKISARVPTRVEGVSKAMFRAAVKNITTGAELSSVMMKLLATPLRT